MTKILLQIALLTFLAIMARAQSTITIDTATEYQTIAFTNTLDRIALEEAESNTKIAALHLSSLPPGAYLLADHTSICMSTNRIIVR
ncbi:MAG: hypothetical protein Q8922_07520 [Bacteroidota bacterium]|nr:hypothetical protein [Bacteroidota bacterium]MDP4233584.1 hypothetical protein [Bacteroidota bacterium]MDP4243642.1 hypothetical protein [Bacteroidota bacterium]MDP4287771.1 hypothetical protein [Bacteroidota bacterium]